MAASLAWTTREGAPCVKDDNSACRFVSAVVTVSLDISAARAESSGPRRCYAWRATILTAVLIGRPKEGSGSTEPYCNVAQDYFRDLSRHSMATYRRRRTAASCQDRRVPAVPPAGGPDDADPDDHAAAAADARRHEAPQHGGRHAPNLRALGRELQRLL